jgi:hypothetical protein
MNSTTIDVTIKEAGQAKKEGSFDSGTTVNEVLEFFNLTTTNRSLIWNGEAISSLTKLTTDGYLIIENNNKGA